MNRSFTLSSLFLSAALLLVAVSSSTLCLAESLASRPVTGLLVLRNGNVIKGEIRQSDDRYHVSVPHGKLQIRAEQVEMFCHTIEEAYLHRRAAQKVSSVDSHIELAGWCMRHELFGHAEAELQAAISIEVDHPRARLLKRQLKQARQLALRKKERQVAAASIPAQPVPLDSAALDKAPQWARALFVRQIQPLVVQSCATSGCHQSGEGQEGGFHLNRLALDGAGHPEATLRNLAALLEQIDWQSAERSVLLQRAREAHGASDVSNPLPSHKFQVLEGWVTQLGEAHQKDVELKTLPLIAEEVPTLQLHAPKISQPTSMAGSGVRTASYEPVDPFDPAAFNRRYAPTAVEKPVAIKQPVVEPTVPHVLTPPISFLPATE